MTLYKWIVWTTNGDAVNEHIGDDAQVKDGYLTIDGPTEPNGVHMIVASYAPGRWEKVMRGEAVMNPTEYPPQQDGENGCLCRTCGKDYAVYLDQCVLCRKLSTRDDDKAWLETPGSYENQ